MNIGIDGVDLEIDGELPEPQLITFEVQKQTEYQKVIYNMLNKTDKKTFIISTQYSQPVIQEKLVNSNIIDETNIIIIDLESVEVDLSIIKEKIEQIPTDSVVYIDSATELVNNSSETSNKILNTIYEYTVKNNLITISWIPYNTQVSEKILPFSDTNIQVRIENELGYEVAQYLIFTKISNKAEISGQFKLLLNESDVDVDTSRNVA